MVADSMSTATLRDGLDGVERRPLVELPVAVVGRVDGAEPEAGVALDEGVEQVAVEVVVGRDRHADRQHVVEHVVAPQVARSPARSRRCPGGSAGRRSARS